MQFIIEDKTAKSIRFSAQVDGIEVGHIYVYFIQNDLHTEPYALLEDLFVVESERKKGFGTALVQSAIDETKKRGCYKIVCTSRYSREAMHSFYEKFGFKNYGVEFRMDI